MDSSPVTPTVAPKFVTPLDSPNHSKEESDPTQSNAIMPRMVSRSPVRMAEFDQVNEDSSGDFSFDDLMRANGSDRPEGTLDSLQHLPRLSLLCCHAHDAESLAIVRDAVLSGENIHQKDPTYGRTPLHWACMFSSAATVDLLLEQGALDDVNEPDNLNATPLTCLINNRELPGHETMVRCLLEAGARLDLVDEGGSALLFQDYLTPALAGTLLQKGLNIDCTNVMRETPLQVASARGNETLVDFFMAHGADVNRRCLLGRTVLHDGELDPGIAIRLLRRGALVNARDDLGQTPLMLACDFSNMPLIRVLLEHGASLAVKSHDGWSAVYCAQNSGHEVHQYLLECAGLTPGTRLASS
jgi:ankyrin repeat protein